MGGPRKYWRDTYEYQRILDILNDYWLTEKDEYEVKVTLQFTKADGQEQEKYIVWRNPDLDWEKCEKVRAWKSFNWYHSEDFKDYVMGQYLCLDTPSGDFARDLTNDNDFPRNVTHDDMKDYLRSKKACKEVMEIFEELYKEYIN